jgi:glycosyltransferase involved in cell wall biosynthesis
MGFVVKIAVLMPAFDEGERLARSLAELAERAGEAEITVFLVDDGSEPALEPKAPLRVVLARHPVNLGQGAAIETARRLATSGVWGAFDAFVTMDADGQHRAEDVLRVARAVVERRGDVALGDRFAGGSNVPAARRVLLHLARFFERAATGLALADAHNGLRAFSPRAAMLLRIRQNRMAHATEITRFLAREKLSVVEVPVMLRYSDESLAKGQGASGAIAILVDLFQSFLFGER